VKRSTRKRSTDAGIGTVVATAERVGKNIRSQVTGLDLPGKVSELHVPEKVARLDLPGKVADLHIPERVAELHIPERVTDARRELAARIEPTQSGTPRWRRRVLWIGLFLVAAGAATAAVLSWRAKTTEAAAPGPAPTDLPRPRSADAQPAEQPTDQPAGEGANGQAPSPQSSPGTRN
jgi:hypothetical protein